MVLAKICLVPLRQANKQYSLDRNLVAGTASHGILCTSMSGPQSSCTWQRSTTTTPWHCVWNVTKNSKTPSWRSLGEAISQTLPSISFATIKEDQAFLVIEYYVTPPQAPTKIRENISRIDEDILWGSEKVVGVTDSLVDLLTGAVAYLWVLTNKEESGSSLRTTFRSTLHGDVIEPLGQKWQNTCAPLELWCGKKCSEDNRPDPDHKI